MLNFSANPDLMTVAAHFFVFYPHGTGMSDRHHTTSYR